MKKLFTLAMVSALVACSDDFSSTSPNVNEEPPLSSVEQDVSSSSVSSSSSVVSTESSSSVIESSSSAKEDSFLDSYWRENCLAIINEYRATEDLPPLVLAAEEKQSCTDKQAGEDLRDNVPHGHFGDCGESAQNSGPNFSMARNNSASAVAEYYLKMMWEEEKELVTSGKRDPNKDEDYPYIGHYLNMKGKYSKVSCGIALSEDNSKGWFNVDFFY